ncbi:MotA/TolQ/ExbB proton channel family protein [Opitutaceae bacterium TAV4]|nr:MotA/TolQ/ExbB proton channel family protein [Opitutaceae bacterium TAV4]RRK00930.1 MotA/TolQ/ExbB proton channel family protein [Opitutaceae bacterium TAV3]
MTVTTTKNRRLPDQLIHCMLLGILALLALPTTTLAWWNEEWALRKKLTIDTTPAGADIAEPVGGAPVLVRLHIGNFQFDQARPDGADIRFLAEDDKTALPYHIAQFDSLLGEAFVWVRVPDIKPGAQTAIWLYYGNQAASSAENAKTTFDADTVLAWHFGERGQPARDFSGHENNAVNAAIPSDGTLIGTGLRFDGNSAITVPAAPSLAWTANAPLTWSAWVKPATLSGRAVIYSRRTTAGSDPQNAFLVGADQGVPFVEITTAGNIVRTPAAAPLTINSWHHLAVVADGPRITLYLDGSSYATLASGIPALDTPATLGGDRTASATGAAVTSGFIGELVEFQLSHTARPSGFIKFLVTSQGGESGSRVVLVSEEEHSGGGGGNHSGYFTVILQNLTFDGWIVIVILAVMSAISLAVMAGKNSYINAVRKGNEHFLKLFNERVAGDLTVLDNANHQVSSLGGQLTDAERKLIARAPLYRLYHIGAEEIRKRLSEVRNGDEKLLSAHAIKAITASMDGGRVREQQRLNKQMVLLTIAISGGPFLGLLGTVVGVMITFAAVAMAGDVNVNAIAPGIAAALLATVAGLAVAIPALFGYNYLLTRVKDVTADMQVFVDEFVTKVAEFYPKRASEKNRLANLES